MEEIKMQKYGAKKIRVNKETQMGKKNSPVIK